MVTLEKVCKSKIIVNVPDEMEDEKANHVQVLKIRVMGASQ